MLFLVSSRGIDQVVRDHFGLEQGLIFKILRYSSSDSVDRTKNIFCVD